MSETQSQINLVEGQPVIVDAYDGPIAGTYVGTRRTGYAFAANRVNLRVRIDENAQGYTEGEVIDALPQRVAAA
jgi:hypothetical protein